MNSEVVTILVYSKYSSSCKRLFEILSTYPLDFLSPFCIDNEKVRKTILNSKIKINYVPCILSIQRSGIVEKYEGEIAFEWIKTIISRLSPPQNNFSQVNQIPSHNKELQQTPQEKRTNIDSLSPEFEDLPPLEEEGEKNTSFPQEDLTSRGSSQGLFPPQRPPINQEEKISSEEIQSMISKSIKGKTLKSQTQ